MNGFLNLLKPPGMTSSDAVVTVRRTLQGEKVGHAGTLDPEVAGVLPIMIGKAARLFDMLVDKEKAYRCEIAFGIQTDTQDGQGAILARSDSRPDEKALLAALPRFVGDILQVPPAFSALKVGGRAAYALAREGNAPELKARPARVDTIDLIEWTGPDSAILDIRCGRGVYVRTLCHDIGQALGCGAYMHFLLRTQSGVFHLADTVTLEDWMSARDKQALLSPMDFPLGHLAAARVSASLEADCRNGRTIGRFALEGDAQPGAPLRVYCGDRFAGIGRLQDGGLRFQAMLMEPCEEEGGGV